MTALLLLALLWPMILLTALWLKLKQRGPVLHKYEAVTLPADSDPALWRTYERWSFSPAYESAPGGLKAFFLGFLPALVNVAKDELRFVGVRPLSRREIKALPHDWQTLYLKSKAGIVIEAYINYGAHPTEDELYSSEAFYSVTASFTHDLKLLAGYLARIIGETFRPSRLQARDSNNIRG